MSEQKRQKWICRVLINNDKSESIKICGIRYKKYIPISELICDRQKVLTTKIGAAFLSAAVV